MVSNSKSVKSIMNSYKYARIKFQCFQIPRTLSSILNSHKHARVKSQWFQIQKVLNHIWTHTSMQGLSPNVFKFQKRWVLYLNSHKHARVNSQCSNSTIVIPILKFTRACKCWVPLVANAKTLSLFWIHTNMQGLSFSAFKFQKRWVLF